MPQDIQGKSYVMVHERISEFHNLYPNGSIRTEIIEMSERFIVQAKVIPDIEQPNRFFSGLAYEIIGSSFINKTSALENCETSAVGRALGMLGIGIDEGVASADEINNANDVRKYSITDEQKEEYQRLLKHKVFDGNRRKTNDWWGRLITKEQGDSALKVMQSRVDKDNKKDNGGQDNAEE